MGAIGFVLAIVILNQIVTGMRERRSPAASARPRRFAAPAAPAAPVMLRPGVFRMALARLRTRWGKPRRATGSWTSLVSARRYGEAARAVDLDDREARTSLALARGGPIADLAAAYRNPPTKRLGWRARRSLPRFTNSLWRQPGALGARWEDDADVLELHVERLLQRGRFAAAARLLERRALRWPEADDVARTRQRAVYAWALAGQPERARDRAAALASETDHAAIARSVHRIAHRLRAATEENADAGRGATRWSVAARNPSSASKIVDRALAAAPPPTRVYPGAIAGALQHFSRATGYLDLDIERVADALAARHHVLVGVLERSHVVNKTVVAVAPAARVVALSSGEVLEWDDLAARSLWGDRALISDARRLKVECIEQDEAVVLPAVNATGRELASRDQARALFDRYPQDPLAAFVYYRVLTAAPSGNSRHPSPEALLGLCAARFPHMRWPEVLLDIALDHGQGPDPARDVLALGSPTRPQLDGQSSLAAARLDETASWATLSAAELSDPIALAPVELGLEWALQASRPLDVDAHLDVLERVHGGGQHARHYRVAREVVWGGAGHAFDATAPSLSAPDALGLALHSGVGAAVDSAAALLAETDPVHPALGVASAVRGLHRGDPFATASAAATAAASAGWTPALADIVGDAFRYLATPDQAVAMAGMLRTPGATDAAAFSVMATAALAGGAYDACLALSRRDLDSGESWGALRHAGIVLRLSRVGAASLEEAHHALASVSRDSEPAYHASMACALALETDPDEAWALIEDVARATSQFSTHLLVSAIANARGDAALSDAHLARAANPYLANQGWGGAVALGLTTWAAAAVRRLAAHQVADAVAGLMAEGCTFEALPPAPAPRAAAWPSWSLDRLALDGHLGLHASAAAHRFPPLDQLAVVDGTRAATARAIGLADAGDPTSLVGLAGASWHPAVSIAGLAASRAGLAVPWSADEMIDRLPGAARRIRTGIPA